MVVSMPIVTICEDQKIETGFSATLMFDHRSRFPIRVSALPLEEETLWEWYFEEWLQDAYLTTQKSDRAKASVQSYGEALFSQVFKQDPDVYAEYRSCSKNLDELQIEIEGKTPEFQAIHWEAMREPNRSPFAVVGGMIRKRYRQNATRLNLPQSDVIRVLVVTARPNGDRDVKYRTISRPLIELLDNSRLPVQVDLVRPGTYEALTEHLDRANANYHMIHLDLHGALLTYDQANQAQQNHSALLFKGRLGRDRLAPFEGQKGFVAFEGEEDGEADFVEAAELAQLLQDKGIPVCILNACQSAKQVVEGGIDGRETSLGARLMDAGLQMVVAMGYSVSVTAATILMQKLYEALFDQRDLTDAVRIGRKALWNVKERKGWFNYTIELEDWLLPVVYANERVQLKLRPMQDEEREKYLEAKARQYRMDHVPTYGFVGRDLEILQIERLLIKHNLVLVQGMGGTGKTTLLTYLGEWWQRTNFVRSVFYFGYDRSAYTVDRIVDEIARSLLDRFELGRFLAQRESTLR